MFLWVIFILPDETPSTTGFFDKTIRKFSSPSEIAFWFNYLLTKNTLTNFTFFDHMA